MKADRDTPKALRDFDHREKMRAKIRRRQNTSPAGRLRLARADRALAAAREVVDQVATI